MQFYENLGNIKTIITNYRNRNLFSGDIAIFKNFSLLYNEGDINKHFFCASLSKFFYVLAYRNFLSTNRVSNSQLRNKLIELNVLGHFDNINDLIFMNSSYDDTNFLGVKNENILLNNLTHYDGIIKYNTYSNANYFLLAKLMEKTSGLPLQKILDVYLCKEFDIDNTIRIKDLCALDPIFLGAADLETSATDLLKVFQLLFSNNSYKEIKEIILSKIGFFGNGFHMHNHCLWMTGSLNGKQSAFLYSVLDETLIVVNGKSDPDCYYNFIFDIYASFYDGVSSGYGLFSENFCKDKRILGKYIFDDNNTIEFQTFNKTIRCHINGEDWYSLYDGLNCYDFVLKEKYVHFLFDRDYKEVFVFQNSKCFIAKKV